MRGRIAKPTALKALQGNPGHRSLDDGAEPAPQAGAPEPPDWLCARGRRKWYEKCAQMMHVPGWLTVMDGDVLALYCSAMARLAEAETAIPRLKRKLARAKPEDRGWLLSELNHARGERKQAGKEAKSYGQELGWSAASRTRIRVSQGQGELPLGEPETPFARAVSLARGG